MRIGIAGGGQLGRMLVDAAHALGHSVIILDPTPNSPASQVADGQIVGDYRDADMMQSLAERSDVLTYEIESVNAEALEKIAAGGMRVHPTPRTLAIIKDKFSQKTHLRKMGIPVADFMALNLARKSEGDTLAGLGYPFVLKARSGGFDGRGNALIQNAAEIRLAVERLGADVYAERFIKFEKELAIVAARTVEGEIAVFPLVETIHKDHICHMTLAPATVPADVAKKAHEMAQKVLGSFEGAGVFGIEMFLAEGEVLVNEVAPRVHNSGHWTIEGSETSQFEQHIRAITGVPLGPTKMKAQATVMVNILGERNGPANPRGVTDAEKIQGVKVHLYGKMETRVKRKMGHLTAVADTLDEAKRNAQLTRAHISI